MNQDVENSQGRMQTLKNEPTVLQYMTNLIEGDREER